jgi:hypothetical protein
MADNTEEFFAGSRGPVDDFKKGLTSWSKYNDPTYLGFLLLFDWTSPHDPTGSYYLGGGSPLLAGGINEATAGSDPESWEPLKGTAMDYLKRNEEFSRMTYLNAFINTLKSINYYMPWYWQSIEGLEEIWKWKHFEDPYKGGDDAILKIACLESIDLKVTALMDFYKKACYDVEHRRMIIPENLRKFKVSIYIEEIRKFQVKSSLVDTLTGSINSNLAASAASAALDNPFVNKINDTLSQKDGDSLLYINGAGSSVMFDLHYCEFDTDESSVFLANANMMLPEMATQLVAFKYENVRQESTYPFKYMEVKNSSGNVGGFNPADTLDKIKERASQVAIGAAMSQAKKLTGRLNGLLLGNVHGFSLGSLQTALTQGSLQSISREFAEAISSVRNNEVGELTGREKAYSTTTVNNNLTGTEKAYEQGESPNTQLSGDDNVFG